MLNQICTFGGLLDEPENFPNGDERAGGLSGGRRSAALSATSCGCGSGEAGGRGWLWIFYNNADDQSAEKCAKLNEIGSRLAEEYHVACLPSDFKKKGGYLRSIELSRQYDLYRQDYCGCVFSKRERDKRIVQES